MNNGCMIRLSGAVLMTVFFGCASAPAANDAFADACQASGRMTPESCQCQARLAKGSLNNAEREALIAAMRDGQGGLQTALMAMGNAKAKVFATKMKLLGVRSRAECP